MVKISDIKDKDSLESWLAPQPQEVSVSIAARAALRVLPEYWAWSLGPDARKGDLTALSVLRSCLISGVAGKLPTPGIKRASDAASVAATNDSFAIAPSADVDTAASVAASVAAAAAASTDAAASVAAAAASSTDAAASDATSVVGALAAAFGAAAAARSTGGAKVWKAVQWDCTVVSAGENPLDLPLWLDKNPMADLCSELRPKILSDDNWQPGDWSFWVDWYEQMLDPQTNPPNWPLLERIALIDPKIWGAGPEAVSDEIAAIQLAFADRALSTGEQFAYSAGRDMFLRNPVQAENQPVLEYCVARLSELSELAQTMGNMQGVLGAELFFVRRAVETHADNPVMVWDNCGTALRMLEGNIDNGACPAPTAEPYVAILQATLSDIRSRLQDDPAVQYVAPHRPKTAPIGNEAAVTAIADATELISQYVEPEVAEEMQQDAATLRDRFASAGRKVAAYVSSAGRVLRIFLAACYKGVIAALDGLSEITARIDAIGKNCVGVASSFGKISAIVGAGGGALAVATNPDKVLPAIEWVTKLIM